MVSPDDFEDYEWDELPADIRAAFETLGYNKKMWDKDKEPEVANYDFDELTSEQKEAALKFGYTKEIWIKHESRLKRVQHFRLQHIEGRCYDLIG